MNMNHSIIKIVYILLLNVLFSSNMFSQKQTNSEEFAALIQPMPKSISSLNKKIKVDGSVIKVVIAKAEEQKAVNYFKYILHDLFKAKIELTNEDNNRYDSWAIKFKLVPFEEKFVNNQYYSIYCDEQSKIININSPSQLGLLYGVVTFSDLIQQKDKSLFLNLYNIKDWPDYSRRIVHSIPVVTKVDELLDFAIRYKVETVAIASRKYSWFKIDEEYLAILKEVKEWKDQYGGPHIMQMHNIYDGKYINTADKKDIDALKNVIKTSIEHGVDKLMILADDTPPFKYGEGYILTYDEEIEKYQHLAEAHSSLLYNIDNWLVNNSLTSELYYVPGFYTYEDMYYGDMSLFDNTPWKDDAYKPFMRDLNFIGLNFPENVFIVWCGPNVRSRIITVDDLNDWTHNLNGRVPFLWDNTIYSHHPFTSTPLFTSYDNDLPSNLSLITAGNGMTVNGNANAEDSRVSIITTIDYLWSSNSYNPEQSLNTAMNKYYGKELTPLLLEFKDVELRLRETIGERRLWFESDTLWQKIREARWVHTKNPFHYHYNYTRMKALRLQLKYSVPEPLTKDEFINEYIGLENQRKNILKDIKHLDSNIFEKINDLAIPRPDFEKLQ
jgi:beta-N-acetylglucosaminidase/Glycosyl hydrolase family 20, domain 2